MIKNKVKDKGYDIETCNAVDLVFNKYLAIRADLLSKQKIRKEEESKKQEDKTNEYFNKQRSFNEKFKDTFNFNSKLTSNYTDKQKEYLRIIYKSSAMKLHPDITKDSGEGMQFLNELKEQWGLNDKG